MLNCCGITLLSALVLTSHSCILVVSTVLILAAYMWTVQESGLRPNAHHIVHVNCATPYPEATEAKV